MTSEDERDTPAVKPPAPLPHDIADALASALEAAAHEGSMKRALAILAQKAAAACQSQRSSFFLFHGEAFRPVMAQYADGRKDPEQWARFRSGSGIVRPTSALMEAVRAGRGVWSAAVPDEHFSPEWTVPFGTRAALAVPIFCGGRVIGAMVVDRGEPVPFSPETCRTAEIFASQAGLVIESARHLENERRSRERAEALARFSVALSAHLDEAALLQTLTDEARAALRAERVAFLRLAPVPPDGETVYTAGFEEPCGEQIAALAGTPLVAEVMSGRAVAVDDARRSALVPADVAEQLDLKSCLAVAVFGRGSPVGVLVCAETTRHRSYADETALAESLASQAGVGIENALLYRQTVELALHDPLTGVGNRRSFEQHLTAELARAARYGHPLTLVIVDADDFKRINDEMGHRAGDRALCRIASILARNARRADAAFRIGGDEFAVVLPETAADGGLAFVERALREAMSGGRADEYPMPLHLSAGMATFPTDAADAEQLIEQADRALYAAKGTPSRLRLASAG